MPILCLDEIRMEYRVGSSTVVALDSVDLSVDDDELVAVVGPSGSGKSTALAIAGALLTPTTGRVEVGGTDLRGLTQRQRTAFRRAHLGLVFQTVNLVPYLTALENLLVIADGHTPDVDERAAALLAELGVAGRSGMLASRLSGGERQRVALGRALINQPDLLLIDEPTSALDTERGRQVMDLLRDEVRRRRTAAVVVTHDPRMVDGCDRVVELRDGRIAQPTSTLIS